MDAPKPLDIRPPEGPIDPARLGQHYAHEIVFQIIEKFGMPVGHDVAIGLLSGAMGFLQATNGTPQVRQMVLTMLSNAPDETRAAPSAPTH